MQAALSDQLSIRPLRSTCVTPGCDRDPKARDRCWNCYQSWWRRQERSRSDIVISELGSLHEAQRAARLSSLRKYNASAKFRQAQSLYLQSPRGRKALQRKREREGNRRRILAFLNFACAESIAQTFSFLPVQSVAKIKQQNQMITWYLLKEVLPSQSMKKIWDLLFSSEELKAAKEHDRMLMNQSDEPIITSF
jgi:hypothetical protein